LVGKEIKTIVNEVLIPGSYETRFESQDYASGVLFYQLLINNSIWSTKKMVILK
jgi:hypothetical protein